MRKDNGASSGEDRAACPTCGGFLSWRHDHKLDNSGLDDGPWLPGHAPRKKHDIDPVAFSVARKRAWETRRAKYGPMGHS